MLYYEDITVGESVFVGTHLVSKQEIIDFAKQWDPQPFHTDEVAAEQSVIGSLSASSAHTFSLTALINHHSERNLAVQALLSTEFTLPHPVKPEDTLTQTNTCLEKRISNSKPGVGILKTTTVLRNQQDIVVMEMFSTFMIKMRSYDQR